MRFLLPIICVVTFCVVSVMVVDAVMPFGFILMRFFKDEPTPTALRVLLLVPFAGTIISSLVNHTFIRSILTSASVFLLIVLWMLGILLFVVYPMPDTPVSIVLIALPAITSIPFLVAVMATMTHNLKNAFGSRRASVT